MDTFDWFIALSLAAVLVYVAAVAILAWARTRSPRVKDTTEAVWRYELAITTWVIAAPGLIVAALGTPYGGLVLLAPGIAMGVIGTGVARGARSHAYAFPLIFLGIADLVVAISVVGTFDSRHVVLADVARATAGVLYLGIATANAIRIFRRGRNASRARREAAAAMVPEHRDPSPTPGAFEPPRDLFVALSTRSR